MKLHFNEIGPSTISSARADVVALTLRVGLGWVFVIGGWWKLSRAIDPERSGALVQQYLASDGYINAFFIQYLFEGPLGDVFSPLMFLAALSTFELVIFFRKSSFSFFIFFSSIQNLIFPVVNVFG